MPIAKCSKMASAKSSYLSSQLEFSRTSNSRYRIQVNLKHSRVWDSRNRRCRSLDAVAWTLRQEEHPGWDSLSSCCQSILCPSPPNGNAHALRTEFMTSPGDWAATKDIVFWFIMKIKNQKVSRDKWRKDCIGFRYISWNARSWPN